MILEIETGGDSFSEIENRIYEAAMVLGVTEGMVDTYLNIDDYGDIVEVSESEAGRWTGGYYEDVIEHIANDLDVDYRVTII